MKPARNHKKKLIVSYKNLSEELKALFKEAYPDGHKDFIQRTDKPNGEPIFCVPLETEDTTYMIKFEMKIDSGFVEEDLDKDIMTGDGGDAEFDDLSVVDKDTDNPDHTERHLHHGDYEDLLNESKKLDKNPELAKELKEAFDDDDEFDDSYSDDEPDEDDQEEDGPSDEDLLELEKDFFVNLDDTDIPPEEMVQIPSPEPKKRGRKKKE